MPNRMEAAFRRVVERDGQRYAEVEVRSGRPGSRALLAYFHADGNGGCRLARVIANDADGEIDWYDNNLHTAFEDVTARLSGSPESGAGEKEETLRDFGERVLSSGAIREMVERQLAGAEADPTADRR